MPRARPLLVAADPWLTSRPPPGLAIFWQLSLTACRLSVCPLQGFTAYLMDNAYPEATRPAHLTSDAYAQYSTAPDDGILPLPGSIAKTDLRLILVHEGWEYAVHAAEVFSGARQDDRVHVATVEFEQRAHVMGCAPHRFTYILTARKSCCANNV